MKNGSAAGMEISEIGLEEETATSAAVTSTTTSTTATATAPSTTTASLTAVASATTTANNYVLIPPNNFSYVEDTVCRCTGPLLKSSIPFLQANQIQNVINISGKKVDSHIANYFDQAGSIKSILPDGADPPIESIYDLELWIKSTIELILHCKFGVTLILGSQESFLECLVIGCLRRVQEWSYISILEEFKSVVAPLQPLVYNSSTKNHLLVICNTH